MVAVWVLGRHGDARAIAPLIAALEDADRGVRERAVQALERLEATEDSVSAVPIQLVHSNASKWLGGDNRPNFPPRNVGTGQSFSISKNLDGARVHIWGAQSDKPFIEGLFQMLNICKAYHNVTFFAF